MASAIVNGILVQGLSDENDNSSHTKEQIYMNGTATDTSDLLKSDTVVSPAVFNILKYHFSLTLILTDFFLEFVHIFIYLKKLPGFDL